MTKKLGMTATVILLLAAVLYSVAWFWIADALHKHITSSNQPEFFIENLTITGFPGPFKIAGAVSAFSAGTLWQTPSAHIKGFPIAGWPVHITLPQGIKAAAPADSEILSIGYLEMEGPYPKTIPAGNSPEALARWRDEGGMITVDHFLFRKDSLKGEGAGYLRLDQNLQPEGVVNARIRGHDEFLIFLKEKGLVENKQALLAGTVMGGLSQPDEESGKAVMDVGITLQNRRLFLGPLPVAQVPEIRWGSGNPPAPPQ